MNPIIQWLEKEMSFFLPQLFGFFNYYNLRDRLPFYVTLTYILGRGSDSKIPRYVSKLFLLIALDVGIVSLYYLLTGTPNDQLVGFSWRHAAPIQYSLQILAINHIAWKTTKNPTYSVALAYNGAAATGYLYEIPFWFYSIKSSQARLLHASYRYTFLISYQIIAIGVFIWLLKKQDINFSKKDLALFLGVFGIDFIMGSKMYVWETSAIVRIPMILYSIYLVSKLRGIQNES